MRNYRAIIINREHGVNINYLKRVNGHYKSLNEDVPLLLEKIANRCAEIISSESDNSKIKLEITNYDYIENGK